MARDSPTEVPGLNGVKQIAAGGTRDYALLSDGEVMAWGEDQNGDLGVEESGSEEELCFGETHAITPIQCSTIPRPVKVPGLGELTGVERIGAGEETAYAIAPRGEKVAAWGAGGKGQLGNGEDERKRLAGAGRLRTGLAGDRNRRRLAARAGAARQRRGLRLGRRRARSAGLRNRAAKPTKRAGARNAAWSPSRSANSATWWRWRPAAKASASPSKKKKTPAR